MITEDLHVVTVTFNNQWFDQTREQRVIHVDYQGSGGHSYKCCANSYNGGQIDYN